MSDRTIDINLTSSTAKTVSQAPSQNEVSEYRARLARVMDRGLVVDRLQVELPSDIHGEWVAKDPAFITRHELLGFKIDTEFAPKKSLNDHGDGTANVGDVVFMTIPKWKKDIMNEVARQKYNETHLRDRRKQKEEQDFAALNQSIGMPTDISSQADTVTGSEIVESLTNTGK